MKRIFIAYTPYHVLISCGLADFYSNFDKNYLIVISDFENAELLSRTISNWRCNPFLEIKVLRGKYSTREGDIIRRGIISAFNTKFLIRYFNKLDKSEIKIFAFNDGNPESQIMAYLNSMSGGKNIYVEDGVAAYHTHVAPDVAAYKIWLARVLWGYPYQHIRVLGTYDYIDEVMVFKPEIIRPELKEKSIRKIPKEVLTHLNDSYLISSLFINYGLYDLNLSIDYIFLIPYSEELISNKLISSFSNMFDKLGGDLDKIFVKYHPREFRGDFLGLSSHPNVTILPQSLPMEVVYLAVLDNGPKTVVGSFSTALLMANHLLKETNVILIDKLLGIEKDYFKIFEQVGIFVPTTIEEFKDYLYSH